MAYTVGPNAILQVVLRYTQAGQELMNVRHYKYTGVTVLADGRASAESVADHIGNKTVTGPGRIANAWAAVGADLGVNLYAVDAQWIYPTRFGVIQRTSPLGGTVPGQLVPTGTQVAIELRGDQARRQDVGGVRIPGFTVDAVGVDSRLTAAAITNFNVLRDRFLDTFTTSTAPSTGPMVPIIFHKASPPDSAVVSQAILKTEIRTMRRRVVGRGI